MGYGQIKKSFSTTNTKKDTIFKWMRKEERKPCSKKKKRKENVGKRTNCLYIEKPNNLNNKQVLRHGLSQSYVATVHPLWLAEVFVNEEGSPFA